MHNATIRDYIGDSKELTAAEVRKLPEGAHVIVHSFDRRGTHQTLEMTVRIGTNKYLSCFDYYSGQQIKRPIRKETDRMCYTEVK